MFPEIMPDSAQAYERRVFGERVTVVEEGEGDRGAGDGVNVGVGGR